MLFTAGTLLLILAGGLGLEDDTWRGALAVPVGLLAVAFLPMGWFGQESGWDEPAVHSAYAVGLVATWSTWLWWTDVGLMSDVLYLTSAGAAVAVFLLVDDSHWLRLLAGLILMVPVEASDIFGFGTVWIFMLMGTAMAVWALRGLAVDAPTGWLGETVWAIPVALVYAATLALAVVWGFTGSDHSLWLPVFAMAGMAALGHHTDRPVLMWSASVLGAASAVLLSVLLLLA